MTHRALGRLACATLASGFVAAALGFVGCGQPALVETSTVVPAANAPEKRGEGGTVVSELDKHVASLVRARDGTWWYASRENGVYRYDGQRIVRYTTEDGLASNLANGLAEDRAGNIIVCCGPHGPEHPAGFCRFDGRGFTKLTILDPTKSEWRLDADDLWFSAGQDRGAVYRYDGRVVHLLPFPGLKAVDESFAKARAQYPNMKFTPYDVYTIYKDRRGHLWFGTAGLGVCRYDGKTLAWAHKTEIGFDPEESFGLRGIVEDREGRYFFTLTGNRYEVEAEAGAAKVDVAAAAAVHAPSVHALRVRTLPGLGPNDPVGAFVSASRDKNGDLWLGVMGGAVCRYDGKTVKKYIVADDSGKPVYIYSTYQDPGGGDGGLWACSQGCGVYKFDGKAFVRFRP